MTVGAIKSQGDNHGKPRMRNSCGGRAAGQAPVVVRDTSYEYYGAPIWDGLNIIKTQTPKVNAFLHALTDGSEEAKRAVETAFWPPNGPEAKKEARKDGSEDIHIKAIGKYPIQSPSGEFLVRIITKMENDLQGQPRAAVNQYLPYKGTQEKAAANGQVADDSVAEVVDDDNGIIGSEKLSELTIDAIYLYNVCDEPPF